MDALPKIHPFEAGMLAALFAVAICLPLAKQLTVGEPDVTALEKRLQAPMPDFGMSWRSWVKFLPEQITSYCGDHFGFRQFLLKLNATLYYKLLRISHWAVLGESGWLFYKNSPPLFSQSLSETDLATWKSYLERRQQWLAAHGIKYLFVVPPDKDSVYAEFLPLTSRSRPPEMPAEQLVRYLRETHSTVDIICLREPLLAAKKLEPGPLYYKEDGHWNSLGAFYGYDSVILYLAKWFPTLKAKSRDSYRLAFAPDERRDIAQAAGLWDFPAPVGPVLQSLTPALSRERQLSLPGFRIRPFAAQMNVPSGLPRAVMLRDSFGDGLAPYLSETFSQIVYLWPSVTGHISPEQEKTMADVVLNEKADVFIEEHVERFLTFLPDDRIIFGGAENSSGATNP